MTYRQGQKTGKRTQAPAKACDENAPTEDENIIKEAQSAKQKDEYTDRAYEDAQRSLGDEERHSG